MRPTLVTPSMEYWQMPADLRLRPRVYSYYLAEPRAGFDASHQEFRDEELLLPDGQAEIVFCGGGAFERWSLNGSGRELVCKSYIVWGQAESVLTRDVGQVRLAGVKLAPEFLASMLRLSPDGRARRTLTLEELGCRALLELEERVLEAASAGAVAAVLDRFFLDQVAVQAVEDPLVRALRTTFDATGGEVSVLKWARAHEVTARTVERRFLAAMGMSPKPYARLVRFRRVYQKLIKAPRSSGATSIDGFYDQSHFTREFRRFTGHSLRSFRAADRAQGTSISDHLLARDGEPC